MRDTTQKQRPPALPGENYPFTYVELARAMGFSVRHCKRGVKRWRRELRRDELMLDLGHRTKRFSANAAPYLRGLLSQTSQKQQKKGGK